MGKLVGADDLTGVERQYGQHRLAPQSVHRPRFTMDHEIDWSK